MTMMSAQAAVIAALFAMCFVFVGGTPPSGPPTNLPVRFFDPNVTSDFGTGFFISGPMWYDEIYEGERVDFTIPFSSYGIWNYTSLANNVSNYFLINEICRTLPGVGSFKSLFSWITYSNYNGQVTIDGRLCNEWLLPVPQLGGNLVLDVLASNSSVPVRFSAPFKPFTSTENGNITYIFSTQFTVEPIDPSVFEIPDNCYHQLVCPAGPTVNTSFYLFHSVDDYTLINTNVADLLGDVGFVCQALLGDAFTYFSWISEYEMEVNTTWGQYGFCNFGSCIGGASDRIGKEAPDGVTVQGGQCANNSDIGNWFSLPPFNSSLCPSYANGTVGINGTEWYGCGWNVIKKVKTIDGTCLQKNGFEQACRNDTTFPFPTAQTVWKAAFATEDPNQGGCPEIGPMTPQQNGRSAMKMWDYEGNAQISNDIGSMVYESREAIYQALTLASKMY
eukprot:TRINITY_DN2828_c0_g1_i1.p1 TRINITY_DN2828_c0_g1~~TRINITY_DN2828_c0_g1_i1.p1  ORF type:complete len:447 (-),score=77.83 TRINITY_DN2828_c0_g1_i1:47-1387(-)